MMVGGTTRNMYSSSPDKINSVTLHLVRYILEYFVLSSTSNKVLYKYVYQLDFLKRNVSLAAERIQSAQS
jgi:hypothetical protein